MDIEELGEENEIGERGEEEKEEEYRKEEDKDDQIKTAVEIQEKTRHIEEEPKNVQKQDDLDRLRNNELLLKEIERDTREHQSTIKEIIAEKEINKDLIKKAKKTGEKLMRQLLALDKESMQNMNEPLKKKKKKLSSAINAIITVIDVHVEKWEKDNQKDKTKTKTRNKTHDNAQDKKTRKENR